MFASPLDLISARTGGREERADAASLLGELHELRRVLPALLGILVERLDEAVEDLSLLLVRREALEELVVHGHESEGGELGVAALVLYRTKCWFAARSSLTATDQMDGIG